MKNRIPNTILWFGIFISIISMLANLLFFALTKAFGEHYLIPIAESTSISSPMSENMVMLATLISGLLATGLYALLSKITPHAILPPFLSITLTAFIVSFGGPMELPGTTMRTKILLSMMHIITGILVIGGFYFFHNRSKTSRAEEKA